MEFSPSSSSLKGGAAAVLRRRKDEPLPRFAVQQRTRAQGALLPAALGISRHFRFAAASLGYFVTCCSHARSCVRRSLLHAQRSQSSRLAAAPREPSQRFPPADEAAPLGDLRPFRPPGVRVLRRGVLLSSPRCSQRGGLVPQPAPAWRHVRFPSKTAALQAPLCPFQAFACFARLRAARGRPVASTAPSLWRSCVCPGAAPTSLLRMPRCCCACND